MSRIKFIFLPILVLSSAVAQDLSTDEVVVDSQTSVQTSSAVQSCVEKLCPNSAVSLSKVREDIDSSMLSTDSLDFYTGLGKTIKEIARLDVQNSINDKKKLQKWLKTAPVITDPAAIKMYNFFKILSSLNQFKYKKINDVYVVDREASRKELNFSEEKLKRYADVIDRTNAIFADTPIKETSEQTVRLYYSEEQLSSMIESALSKIDADLEVINKNPKTRYILESKDFISFVDTKKIRETLKVNRNAVALEDLNNIYAFSTLFKVILFDSDMAAKLGTSPLDLQKESVAENFDKTISEDIANYEAVLKEPNRGIKFLSACSNAYFTAQGVLPSDKQLADFSKRVDFLKANFFNKMKTKMSSHSAGIVAKEIKEKWNTILPMSREQHKKMMTKMVNESLIQQRKESSSFDNFMSTPHGNELTAIMLSVSQISYVRTKTDWGMDDDCVEITPSILPDEALKERGLAVGPLVIKFGADAEGVTYHEMGHLLRRFLYGGNISVKTSADFKRTRMCLRGIHRNMGDFNGAFYESEDYADYAASVVDEPSKNAACVFTRLASADGYKNYRLAQSDDTDTHSSDFYRLLNIHYQKNGSIPAVCRQAVIANGETPNFTKCQ